MQSGDKGRTIRRIEAVVVKYYKCDEKRHKYRVCSLWEKKVKKVMHPVEGKAYQRERRGSACSVKRKAQERERRVRRVEEKKAAYMAKPREV